MGAILSNVANGAAPAEEAIYEPQLLRAHAARTRSLLELAGILLFTLLGFFVMGYHPGLEDDGLYLAAVKADLNPALFPHNADFFRLQMRGTCFDTWMAHFVHSTGIPVAWSELLWQLASLFLILYAVKMIANRLFQEEHVRWAGVAMVAAMFTLPVAGTALYLADQHLHPRTLSTAMILLAVSRILNKKPWQAVLLLIAAVLLHPLMAVFGISFCIFLAVAMKEPAWRSARAWRNATPAAIPLAWVFAPAGPAWNTALHTRTYYFLYKWTWYEWLGALGPLVFFWVIWWIARKREEPVLARFALAVFAYGVFQQALAMVLLWPSSLVRVTPFQPLRYLHLVYLLFVLTAGCLLGKLVLRRSAWRWTAFLVAVNGCMFAWQCVEFSGSQHLELPWREPSNPWLQAFAWVRTNTPPDAYFALDPHYLDAHGEDYHGFRALAERSALADGVKDAVVVTIVPELGPAWLRQVQAEKGFDHFALSDFERLKTEFGVDWVLVADPPPDGLVCRWHNNVLAACQIP